MTYETIDTAGRTDVGKVRQQNEDDWLARADIGLWAVADGMGGHEAGDVASAMVIEQLKLLPVPDSATTLLHDCADRMQAANEAIRAAAAARGQGSMGTTVAILLAAGPFYACLWCGDSRIYRLRGRQIAQLTRDHSEVQDMIDQGLLTPEDARNWPRKNIITRAIGVFPQVDLDLQHGEIENGDIFVLCSDGLTAHVADDEILDLAATGTAQQISDRLVATVLDRGATDNVTVIVVRFLAQDRTVFAPAATKGQGWS